MLCFLSFPRQANSLLLGKPSLRYSFSLCHAHVLVYLVLLFGLATSSLLFFFFFPRLCFFMARCLYTYHSDERPRKAASKKSRFSLCYFCDWCYSLYSIVRASFFLLLFLFLLFSLLTLDLESTTMSMVDRHRADTLAFTRNT